MAAIQQQPDIPIVRGGCSIDERGKGVSSVCQSSATLCILSTLLVMLQMCGFIRVYGKICMCVYLYVNAHVNVYTCGSD